MNIKIEPVLLEQQAVFAQLMNLYNYDFTEYNNDDINEHGYYYGYYNLWTEDKHHYFIRIDGKLAGFVIVQNGGYKYLDDKQAHNIYEFFVMKKYRRNGVGIFAAKTIFDMFKGTWEVCQMQNNSPARKFWKCVISEYTNNNYREVGTANDDMVGFIFD